MCSSDLRGKQWTVTGTADSSNPGVQELMNKLNRGIANDGSQARISDLNVFYDFNLKARNISTSIDYKVILEGKLTNYVITKDSQRTLIDLGWRGLSVDGEIVIDGVEINIPLNLIRSEEHTSELQSQAYLVCRLLLEKKKTTKITEK